MINEEIKENTEACEENAPKKEKKPGKKPSHTAAAQATSYKADDFFAAALRRSFGDEGEE